MILNLGDMLQQKLMEMDTLSDTLSEFQYGKYVKDFQVDENVISVLKVAGKHLQETRDGKFFLLLTLADRTGIIRAVDRFNARRNDEQVSVGSVIRIQGKVVRFESHIQINAPNSRDAIRLLQEGEYDPKKFIEISSKNIRQMYEQLVKAIEAVGLVPVKELLSEIFIRNDRLATRFIEAPAAINVHHAYKGGLLEHSLDVMNMCLQLMELYPTLDIHRDILVAGALLHDIGKVDEYHVLSSGIVRTDVGEMVGHIGQGVLTLRDMARKVPGFPPEILVDLEHIILSHHGELEWGSPVLPKTIEAFLVHAADNLDSKVAQFREMVRKSQNANGQQGESNWSDYNKFLSRRVRTKGVK
ncbi:MAG TPA: HD domain-containing protein [Thermotogota bacterium]|nr:HD domain-containing protein [Thermotogota bacterium]HRW92154.1 HD domain-containing protein [Thermotogota bacterium]